MNEHSILSLISIQLGRRRIQETDRFYEDLGAESMDLVNLAVAIEDNFGIFIPEEELASIRTVSDLVECVKSNESRT